MDWLNHFSAREKNLWSELLVDIIVALHYFPRMFLLLKAGDDQLTGAAMTGLITSTIIVAIIASTVISLFLHTSRKPDTEDERDHLFAYRGNRLAYFTLVAGVVLIMAVVVLQSRDTAMSLSWLPELTAIGLAHLLLLSLVLSSAVKTLTQLFYYRRGY